MIGYTTYYVLKALLGVKTAYKLRRARWWRFEGNITGNVIAWCMIGAFFLALTYDLIDRQQTVVYYAQAEELKPVEPIPALIEVKINWTPERIEKEIRNTFPEDPATAVAIAWAESQLNANAYNPESHIGCNGSVGIMQIACVHNRKNKEALKDIKFNLKVARQIYDSEGWKPWGAFTDGRYKQYKQQHP